jgi:hypothetical protein
MGACCGCADGGTEQVVDGARMTTYSKELTSLFRNDVFLVVFDACWNEIWSFSTSPPVGEEYRGQLRQIHAAISDTESAIQSLNESWRVEELASFRLVCLSSRIYVWLLGESYHLVVVNKFNAEEEPPPDPPDFDQRANGLCDQIKGSIFALTLPLVQ